MTELTFMVMMQIYFFLRIIFTVRCYAEHIMRQ